MDLDQLRQLRDAIRLSELLVAINVGLDDELTFVRSDLIHAVKCLERVIKRKEGDGPPAHGRAPYTAGVPGNLAEESATSVT